MLQSLGMGLDDKAIEAVRRWRFAAGTIDGTPAPVEQAEEVQFQLHPAGAWRVKRCFYQMHPGIGPVKKSSVPALTRYVSPDPQACSSPGAVFLNLSIDKKGNAQATANATSTQQGRAAEGAVGAAISNWLFAPATRNGKPWEGTGFVEMECSPAQADAGETSTDNRDSVFKAGQGNGVSAPTLIFKIEPEYSEAARKAKFSGVVVLSVIVDETGHASSISVTRPLGLGLDEMAMRAVNQWRFRPGMKDGKAVHVRASVEVSFKLL